MFKRNPNTKSLSFLIRSSLSFQTHTQDYIYLNISIFKDILTFAYLIYLTDPQREKGLGNCSVNREPRIPLIKNICNQPPKWLIKYVTEYGASKRKKNHKSIYFSKIKTLY